MSSAAFLLVYAPIAMQATYIYLFHYERQRNSKVSSYFNALISLLNVWSLDLQEMKELAALAYRDTSPESRDFWKNELAQAIREIEQMYAEKMEDMKADTEANYGLKVMNDLVELSYKAFSAINYFYICFDGA